MSLRATLFNRHTSKHSALSPLPRCFGHDLHQLKCHVSAHGLPNEVRASIRRAQSNISNQNNGSSYAVVDGRGIRCGIVLYRVSQLPHVLDNKQQASVVITLLFINTAASVIGVCRSRANAHPDSQHHAIAPVPFQRMFRAQTSYPMHPLLNKRGGSVAKSRHTCGSKSSKGLRGASSDPMSKLGRLNLGILVTKNRNTYTKLGSQKGLLDRPRQLPHS